MTALGTRAFVIRWKDLQRWVVPSAAILSRTLPAGWRRVRVGEVVTLASNAVKVEPAQEYKMAGVKWYGEGVFHRETVRGDETSAKWLSPLIPGALIYNRLFAWKASFAVVPVELGHCFVSNEFPQFIPDPTKVLPEYLYLWSVSNQTVKAVNAASTGSAAVSRNRFREDYYLDFEIPLPPLPDQRRIVAAWEAARSAKTATAVKTEQLERDIAARFLADLGLAAPTEVKLPKAFAVPWSDFHRWSVSYSQLVLAGMDLSHTKFPLANIGSVAAMIQYGTSAKANTAGRGTAVIRMNNLVDGQLDLRKLKHLELPECEVERLKLLDGDILFNRTNSKELVGKCAVFHEPGEYVFASYLIRVRVNPNQADPDFIVFALNSPIGRQQIDAMSRQIIGQANVNSEELRSLQVPLPPLPIQRQIVQRIAERRTRIAELKADAKVRADAATADVEAMILGMKPV
jgi:type I restriction enzyme S subunit